MIGVLRITFAFFSMVPLQRWFNLAGLLLLAIGLITGLRVDTASRIGSSSGIAFVLVIMGLILVCLTPAFAGGIGIRFAATPSTLHLRPHGRAKLLLGATLAISLLALLAVVPALLAQWAIDPARSELGGASQGQRVGPLSLLNIYQLAWTALALLWICIFALSRTMLAFALMGVIPIAGIQLARHVIPLFPSIHWVFAVGVAAWVAFVVWFLRTDGIVRPVVPVAGMSNTTGFEGSGFFNRLSNLGAPRAQPTSEQSVYHYLFGCASPLFFAVVGLWVGALFAVVAMFGQSGKMSAATQLMNMLPFYAFSNAALGYTTARRARHLWLRTPMDRAALFRYSERWAHVSSMVAWSVTAVLVLGIALFTQPERAPQHLLFVLVQALMATALGYMGLALVRRWSVLDVGLVVIVSLLFMIQGFGLAPLRAVSPSQLALALVAAAAANLLLRAWAAHRWRDLDWRVAKVARMPGMKA